jgi:hypothetical protein
VLVEAAAQSTAEARSVSSVDLDPATFVRFIAFFQTSNWNWNRQLERKTVLPLQR